MKVLHLSSERTWRGGEQQIAYLIQGSIKKGVEIHVASRVGSAFSKFCLETNTSLLEVAFKNEFDLKSAFQIKEYCKTHRIDILHMHSSHSHAIGVWSKILGNPSKLILSRRVDFPIKKNWASHFKFNYPKLSAIVCISEKIKAVLLPDIKRKEILHTVLSGIDLNRFKLSRNNNILHKEYNLPNETRLVGNISAIAEHKDYYTFVNTAEKILKDHNNVTFIIIGDGPLLREITEYIHSKKLEEKIIITGFRNDIIDIIKELDVFLMTSKTEGLGTTILDAFANKVPVVATAAGGIPEAVIHNQTGLIAPVGDFIKLSSNLKRLLEDKELEKTLTNNALSWLQKKFTTETMVQGNLDLYKKLTSIK